MKLKLSLILVIAALVTFGLSGDVFAFHNGGVAACESCHTMHNSANGKVMSRNTSTFPVPPTLQIGQAGPMLLQGTDQSSTCLNCHATFSATAGSYKVMSYGVTIPTQRTPGGDFGWLRKSSTKGHSIVAADFALGVETKKTGNVAPGGTYPVANLHCSSCHDPHGTYRRTSNTATFVQTGAPIAGSGSYGADGTATEAVGAYRLLAGSGYKPKSAAGAPALTANPMIAATSNPYNASEATTEVIVNYGDGTVGQWCGQCHAKMHEGIPGGGVVVHPNDEGLTGGVDAIYNSYVGSGNMGGGAGSGYTSLIPVAYDNIVSNASLSGHFSTGATVDAGDRVMCLSCHRAHASGFDYMLRFPIVEVMTIDDGSGNPTYWKGGTNAATVSLVSGLTVDEMTAALYDRPASKWPVEQRTLCNKCHGKD
jgi:cytochrome c553